MSRVSCNSCHRTFVISSSNYCPFCGNQLRRDAVDDAATLGDAVLDLGTAYLIGSALDSLVNSVDTSSDSFSVGSDWSGGGGDSGGGGSSSDW